MKDVEHLWQVNCFVREVGDIIHIRMVHADKGISTTDLWSSMAAKTFLQTLMLYVCHFD